MQITCGPAHDIRTLNFELPADAANIAVCVSGGIDSAIMYHVLLEENIRLGNLHNIVPVTVWRKEGSKNFAKLVIAHVLASFGKPYQDPTILGDPTLPEDQQVKSAVQAASKLGFRQAYVGIIDQLDEHTVGWVKLGATENNFYRTPLRNLQKSHIIDLVVQRKQQALFYITHACDQTEIGRCGSCNGCRERTWGFEQLALSDPSML
jgi:hypothetical protein